VNSPPPEDLMAWPKKELARELQRLRAILREHADQVSAPHSGGGITDVAGDPRARGGALIDARGAVLLDSVEVVLVDTRADEPLAMVLRLAGRVNFSTARADTAYIMGPDGAAGIVSELAGLAQRAGTAGEHGQRFGGEFDAALTARMQALGEAAAPAPGPVTLFRCPSDGHLRDWSCCHHATDSAQDYVPIGQPGDAAARVRQERDDTIEQLQRRCQG